MKEEKFKKKVGKLIKKLYKDNVGVGDIQIGYSNMQTTHLIGGVTQSSLLLTLQTKIHTTSQNGKEEEYRLKPLLKKMSYEELVKECEREGWGIPSIGDLKGKEIAHNCVWTNETVPMSQYEAEDIKYGVKLGTCYVPEVDKGIILNKNFKIKCVVWVKNDKRE